MLRSLLIATAMLTASSACFAHGDDHDYGRVVSVEPRFVISIGTRQPDGYRMRYESGESRYWTHTSYYPSNLIVVSPSYRVQPVYDYRDDRRHWDHHGWSHRRGDQDDRHDERREHYHHDDD